MTMELDNSSNCPTRDIYRVAPNVVDLPDSPRKALFGLTGIELLTSRKEGAA